MKPDFIELWQKQLSERLAVLIKKIESLKGMPREEADRFTGELHEAVFSGIDCLSCANCCRTTPALLNDSDIRRLSRHLGCSVNQFRRQYVLEDLNGDLSFRSVPCVFLQEDNRCLVYDFRPDSCRDYPHTGRPGFYRYRHLHRANLEICPAVFQIIDRITPD